MPIRVDPSWLGVPFSTLPIEDGVHVTTGPDGALTSVSLMVAGRCIERLELDGERLWAAHQTMVTLDAAARAASREQRAALGAKAADESQPIKPPRGPLRGQHPGNLFDDPEAIFQRFVQRAIGTLRGLHPASPDCSFCGRPASEVGWMVRAPAPLGRAAHICEACVALCIDTLGAHPGGRGDLLGGPLTVLPSTTE